MSSKAIITSIASYVPETVLTNADLETMVETSDEWIVARTGIKERRIAGPNEFTSTMAAEAAKRVLARSKIDPLDIDLILVTTMTPDYLCPSTACLVQAAIKATNAGAVDIEAACTGFIYGLSMAKAYIESGMYQTILVIASEKNSVFTNYADRNTCIIFGDGAGAALITKNGRGLSIDAVHLGASGEEADLLKIPAGGCRLPSSATSFDEKLHTMQMNGRELFKHAVRRMEESILACLAKVSLTPADINWLVAHQANLRIIDALAKRFEIDASKVPVTIDSFGNTSSATIPITLDVLLNKHILQPRERIALTAFGGGLTWGSAILTVTGALA